MMELPPSPAKPHPLRERDDEQGDRPGQQHLAIALVQLHRRHGTDRRGERLARADRDGNEHEDDESAERRDDSEAAPRRRPELSEQNRERDERCQDDDGVHEQGMEGKPGELQNIVHEQNTRLTRIPFTRFPKVNRERDCLVVSSEDDVRTCRT